MFPKTCGLFNEGVGLMGLSMHKVSLVVLGCLLLAALATSPAFAQVNPNCPSGWTGEICSVPGSEAIPNTYVGKVSGSKTLTIYNNTSSGTIYIETIAFTCTTGSPADWGISSGTVPFQMGTFQTLTHYSIFFQPHSAITESCNFVLTMLDGYVLNVPLTATGLSTTAASSLSTKSMTFPNQTVGVPSVAQTVTITNSGTSTLNLEAINIAPPSFTTSAVTFPYKLTANSSLTLSVYYTPSQVTSEYGVLDLDYDAIPDNGVTLAGNGIAATALAISTNPTLPQATQGYAYQATLATSGGVGPYTWSLASGSTLPSGLTLSSAGVITGTVASTVAIGNSTFTAQVTDTSNGATASSSLTIGVYAYIGASYNESCNDISWNDPVLNTPLLALNDLGTGNFENAYQGGLYPNGSNVRPAAQDSYGVTLANAIQPLDSNGNPSPTGKYVFMAIGESTAQNEFNRFLPIANADPAKNPNMVIVNGAQGGATPNLLTSTTSTYWTTVLENYLPQNSVTQYQVVAIWIEDTDGIATGTFPTDVSNLQSEYETLMQTMLTLFPNLKMVYFSSRVYAGYSNGLTTPDNPEPYAYEVGYAVKWAIGDQLNGNANLCDGNGCSPVLAPWMSWGTYYWSNGMLGRSDGLEWDCEDFSFDGTHPSTFFGQLKVATALLQFLKTDDTTKPWYLAPVLGLTATAGNNQSGIVGTALPTALTVLASNVNSGVGNSGVTVSFSDGGVGGSFNPPSPIVTGTNGAASTTYTLPPAAQTVTITATSTGYTSTTFTETATATGTILALTSTAGNNQTGGTGTTLPTALTVTATSNGVPVAGVSVTFIDNGAGGTFGTPTVVTGSNGTASSTYTLPATAQTVSVTASSAGYTSASFTEIAETLALSPNGGNNQTGGIGTTLPVALTVLASNDGNPVSGLSVTFVDNGAGGTFGSPTAVTGANGIATTTYTLPANAQTVTITASSSGYTSATFSEIAAVDALSATAGNNQTGMVNVKYATALTVTATSNGVPVSGVSVTFTDGSAGGTFGTPTGVTGSNGTASSTYTPTIVGVITITAAGTGYTSATFTETSTPTVTGIVLVSGGAQSGTVGTPLALPIVMKARNAQNKPVSGAPITFSDAGAGGSFSPNPATTGSTGQASTTYTLPTKPKSINLSASDGSVMAKTTEKSVVGSAVNLTIVSGNNQTGLPSKALPKALVVSVTDLYKNPISGVTVTFTDNGGGGTFSTTTPATGTNGQASVTYTCGTKAQTVTISASTSTLGPVNFTETVK
jgi:hypothetical protein